MGHRQTNFVLGECLMLPVILCAFSAVALGQVDGLASADLSLQQGYRSYNMRSHERRLQAVGGISLLRGLPSRFTIRPVIDNSLCVNRVQLTAQSIMRARARSGLPPSTAEELEEYDVNRLILMPCVGARTETFLAEAALGRSYRNNDIRYRIGFLKNPSDLNQCLYGVNSTYTDNHPVFGVTGTQFYLDHRNVTNTSMTYTAQNLEDMSWYDDQTLSFASYIQYGYDPVTMLSNTTFRSPNPLPPTMLDASDWGPFYSSWGPCMRNPTLDSATPTDTVDSEMELRYQTFIFVDVPATQSISHLPALTRKMSYAIAALGPDRPQPDLSPLSFDVDAGQLSSDMGGSDKPYGTGYASLVSNELCMTASVIKEGAQVRLARCNPVAPSTEQVFQIVSLGKPSPSNNATGQAG